MAAGTVLNQETVTTSKADKAKMGKSANMNRKDEKRDVNEELPWKEEVERQLIEAAWNAASEVGRADYALGYPMRLFSYFGT